MVAGEDVEKGKKQGFKFLKTDMEPSSYVKNRFFVFFIVKTVQYEYNSNISGF